MQAQNQNQDERALREGFMREALKMVCLNLLILSLNIGYFF